MSEKERKIERETEEKVQRRRAKKEKIMKESNGIENKEEKRKANVIKTDTTLHNLTVVPWL